jgi:hypothetical protein
MTSAEAAKYLRKSTGALRVMVCRGHIRARKFHRRLYFKRWELDRLQQEGKGLTWDQVIDRWETTMRSGQSIYLYQPTTIMDHVALLRKWTASWLNKPAAEINSGDAREVLNQVELEGGRVAPAIKIHKEIKKGPSSEGPFLFL